MLCMICERDYLSGNSQVPPAAAKYIVIGLLVPTPLALCEDHANQGPADEPIDYRCIPIQSEAASPYLNIIATEKYK